jgi:hypothetical protein
MPSLLFPDGRQPASLVAGLARTELTGVRALARAPTRLPTFLLDRLDCEATSLCALLVGIDRAVAALERRWGSTDELRALTRGLVEALARFGGAVDELALDELTRRHAAFLALDGPRVVLRLLSLPLSGAAGPTPAAAARRTDALAAAAPAAAAADGGASHTAAPAAADAPAAALVGLGRGVRASDDAAASASDVPAAAGLRPSIVIDALHALTDVACSAHAHADALVGAAGLLARVLHLFARPAVADAALALAQVCAGDGKGGGGGGGGRVPRVRARVDACVCVWHGVASRGVAWRGVAWRELAANGLAATGRAAHARTPRRRCRQLCARRQPGSSARVRTPPLSPVRARIR